MGKTTGWYYDSGAWVRYYGGARLTITRINPLPSTQLRPSRTARQLTITKDGRGGKVLHTERQDNLAAAKTAAAMWTRTYVAGQA